MIQRYHVDLAVISLTVGAVVLATVVLVPRLTTRAVALAAACGVLVLWSGGADGGGPFWLVAAMLLVVLPDDNRRPHPLARFALVLTVVALAGIWAAVPDTEAPLALALTLAPLALLHLIRGRVPGPVGTAAVVLAVVGAAWVGSAGWRSALAAVGAVGLIASVPLVNGFREVTDRRVLMVLVGLQFMVGLFMPRFVMSRAVHVAGGVSIGVNAVLVLVTIALLGYCGGGSAQRERL